MPSDGLNGYLYTLKKKKTGCTSIDKPVDGIESDVDRTGDGRVAAGHYSVMIVHWTGEANDSYSRR